LALFQNTRVLEALTNTLIIGVISTIISTTLGHHGSHRPAPLSFKFKTLINGLVYLPILIPEIVMGLSLYWYCSPSAICLWANPL
jgi:spermidine/putrescine transport system permease protein